MATSLTGLKLLIVEDNYLIASLIEQILADAGCIVSQPIPQLVQAQDEARGGDYNAAVLDINLNGERVYPVADILSHRNIPYLFLTGYGAQHVRYSERPRLRKPFKRAQLLDAVSNIVS